MYAIIETGGKQYRVELGSEIQVDRMTAEPGSTLDIDRVLLVADGDTASIGAPTVVGALVRADVVRQDRGEKIQVFKYKPKARRRVKKGHRQDLTVLRIADIQLDGKSAAKDAQTAQEAERRERQKQEKQAAEQAEADKALADKLAEQAEAARRAEKAASAAKKPRRTRRSAASDEATAAAESEETPATEPEESAEAKPETTEAARPTTTAAHEVTEAGEVAGDDETTRQAEAAPDAEASGSSTKEEK